MRAATAGGFHRRTEPECGSDSTYRGKGACVEEYGDGGVSGLSGGWKIPRRHVDAIEKMRRRYYTDWRIVEAPKVCR
jgi:hypothetical protein